MDGQISITEYQNSLSYDRKGRTTETPSWVPTKRCNNCIHWEMDPVSDQPPDGWGVNGLCQFIHEGQQGGYQHTDQWSKCQDWRSKYAQD